MWGKVQDSAAHVFRKGISLPDEPLVVSGHSLAEGTSVARERPSGR